jgi:hypothetical protein
VAVNAFGGVSGAHFISRRGMLVWGGLNRPAVAISGAARRRPAAAAIKGVSAGAVVQAISASRCPRSGDDQHHLIVEAVLTFLLITAIYGTAVDERGKAVKVAGSASG